MKHFINRKPEKEIMFKKEKMLCIGIVIELRIVKALVSVIPKKYI